MEHTYSLRPLKETDAARMLEWMRDENVTAYLRIGGADTKLRDVQDFIASAKDESLNLHRAIVDENDTYLGTVSLKNIDHMKKQAEYAIAMHPDGMGCGAAAVATDQICKYAFKILRLRRVYLNVMLTNIRAIRFYEKMEFLPVAGEASLYIEGKIPVKWYEKREKE